MKVANVYVEGWRLAVLGEPGRKWLPAVVWESGNLRITKLPKDAKLEPPGGTHQCSPKRIARRLLAIGRKWGMTRGARGLLTAATL